MSIYQQAKKLVDAGISVIPIRHNKAPAVASWSEYQRRLPTDEELRTWYANDYGIARINGQVSGNLETIDFDVAAEEFDGLTVGEVVRRWSAIVKDQSPNLLERLTIIATPKPGFHVVYRCESAVDGNQKLAYVKNREQAWRCVIETRGEGGYALCPGSPGWCHPSGRTYEHYKGPALNQVATISSSERLVLLTAAKSLSDKQDTPATVKQASQYLADDSPGAIFNVSGTWEEILEPAGFGLVETVNGVQRWKRPGGSTAFSATAGFGEKGLFYAFSPNCGFGIESGRGYDKFGLFARIHHNGNFDSAANDLVNRGYDPSPNVMSEADVLRWIGEDAEAPTPKPASEFPAELLSVPGFVDNLAAYIDSQAYKRQPVLAYAASLSLMGALIGRKTVSASGARANLYAVGLAASGSGKENALRIISDLCFQAEAGLLIGPGDLTSGSALENAVYDSPSILFLIDEFGEFLRAARGNDFRREIQSVLLKLFTKSDGVYACKGFSKATQDRFIQVPNCNLYGATVPHSFFESLCEESITGGFLPRCLIFEGDNNAPLNEVSRSEIPEGLIEIVKHWRNFLPNGVWSDANPQPYIVAESDEAKAWLWDYRKRVDGPYTDEQVVERCLWSRAGEKAAKLALIHACSADHERPFLDLQSAEWATKVVDYLTERLLDLSKEYIADSDSHRALQALQRLARRRRRFNRTDGTNVLRKFAPYVQDWAWRTLEESGLVGWTVGNRGGKTYYLSEEKTT